MTILIIVAIYTSIYPPTGPDSPEVTNFIIVGIMIAISLAKSVNLARNLGMEGLISMEALVKISIMYTSSVITTKMNSPTPSRPRPNKKRL